MPHLLRNSILMILLFCRTLLSCLEAVFLLKSILHSKVRLFHTNASTAVGPQQINMSAYMQCIYICICMHIYTMHHCPGAPNLIGSDTMYYQIWSCPLAGSVILIIDTFVNKTECSLEKTIFGVFWNKKWLRLALCLSKDSIDVLQMNAETFTLRQSEGEIFFS